MINRRQFIKAGIACGGMGMLGCVARGKATPEVPSYLKGYEELYVKDPRQAAQA